MPKITSITPNGQWNEFYKMDIRFDDGEFGTAFAKSQTPPYKVGDEVEYTKNEKGTIKIQRGDQPRSAWTPGPPPTTPPDHLEDDHERVQLAVARQEAE